MPRGFSRLLRRAGVMAVALGGVALAAPSVALANPVCGKVLHHSVTLNSDMNCTSANDPSALDAQSAALFVGTNGITINLNGFTITGDGSILYGIDNRGDWGPNAPNSGGISGPGAGFNHVTVKNGNVTGPTSCTGFFSEGISAVGVTSMTVSAMSAHGNAGDGVGFFFSDRSTITGSHFNHNCLFGTEMGNNAAIKISDSTFSNNTDDGISDFQSQATLNGVRAINNGGAGIGLSQPVAPYLVENSTADGNKGFAGFDVSNNQFNTVTFNNNAAENNTGWGFWSKSHSKGTKNDYENNGSPCHNVGGCFLSP